MASRLQLRQLLTGGMDLLSTLEHATPLPAPPLPATGERWALFLDIDGTLAGFAPDPAAVRLDQASCALLARLSGLLGGALAVLSGRSLAEVDRVLAPLQLPAGALHGAECRTPDGMVVRAEPPAASTARIAAGCRTALAALPGAWLEEKSGIAYALHFRAAPQHAAAALQLARQLAAASDGHYAVQPGDCVVELKPAAVDKGQALERLLALPPFRGRRPVKLGDDLTDEAAFVAARRHDGIGVVVGPRRPTAAAHALCSPAAVLQWLGRLADQLDHHGASP